MRAHLRNCTHTIFHSFCCCPLELHWVSGSATLKPCKEEGAVCLQQVVIHSAFCSFRSSREAFPSADQLWNGHEALHGRLQRPKGALPTLAPCSTGVAPNHVSGRAMLQGWNTNRWVLWQPMSGTSPSAGHPAPITDVQKV
jgi:hypothetical protein